MTEEQLNALRDAVARDVMGWTDRRVPWAYSDSTVCWHCNDVAVITRHAWRPDADDRQSSQVLDRMLALGFRCSIEVEADQTVVGFSGTDADSGPVTHADRRIALLQAALTVLKI